MSHAPNPFYVLELPPDCTRAEVERAGQRILAMLELGLSGATSYEQPSGRAKRDASGVREAMAQLRDPQRRLVHELWAVAQPWSGSNHRGPGFLSGDLEAGFGEARATLGWRR